MPNWWRHINKRVFNPYQLKRDNWPILRHVGRASGKTHRTPLGPMRKDNGYYFLVVYGPETDWLQNVLASGHAVLEIDGGEVQLAAPRLVSIDEAYANALVEVKRPAGILNITQALEMDAA